MRETKIKLRHLVILILLNYSLAQNINKKSLNVQYQTVQMSIDDNSGAMYSFNGSSSARFYHRSGVNTVNQSNVSIQGGFVGNIYYGQVVTNNHLALIVTKINSPNLHLQVHNYDIGNPPA
jgi:hypothetical protein